MKDLVLIRNGFPFDSSRFSPDGTYPVVRIRDLNARQAATRYDGPTPLSAWISQEDVLIGMDGDFSVGRWLGDEPALLNQRMAALASADATLLRYVELAIVHELAIINTLAFSTTVKHLSSSEIGDIRVPVPATASELRRIAAFLDYETARIDELITEQGRLKVAIGERRHATTVAAVSGELLAKGMCASSVPWLQRHAVDWPPVRIRFVARLGSGHTPSRSNPEYWQECTIPWITTGEVSQIRDDRVEYLTETRERVSDVGVRNSAAVVHPKGTVVLSRTASAGFSAIMGLDMATSQDFVTWTCGPRLRPRYLLLCLRAMRPDLLGRLAMGSTHKTIYFPDVESLTIPLPPVEEQDLAVELAWIQLRDIDATVDALDDSIHLLRERREALITAAVTGQIGVRSWRPPDDWTAPEAA